MGLPAGFTEDNEISLFEALGIPMTDKGYTVMDQFGTVRRAMTINPSQVVKGEIEAYLNDITEFTAAKQTRCLKYLSQWDQLELVSVRMLNGSVGDLTNITQDVREQRDLIRERIRVLVPFYDRYTMLKKLSEGPESQGIGSGNDMMIVH